MAFDDENWLGLADAIEARATPMPGGCLVWPGQKDRDGYARVDIRNRKMPAHRLVLRWLFHGPVPSFMPVHHTCGNKLCVNRLHLKVVHPVENTAEMLERTAYEEQIRELKQALWVLDPSHPLLKG